MNVIGNWKATRIHDLPTLATGGGGKTAIGQTSGSFADQRVASSYIQKMGSDKANTGRYLVSTTIRVRCRCRENALKHS